jgi:hypothetical protein
VEETGEHHLMQDCRIETEILLPKNNIVLISITREIISTLFSDAW